MPDQPQSQSARQPRTSADVMRCDSIASAAAMLAGVSDALTFRAASENDDMLAMLASVIDDQVLVLRALV